MHNGPGVKGTQDPKDGLPVKSRSQASRDWEGLGSLKVYLQSFLKSSGMSLKGVMQNNDIISFLFSRGQRAHIGWLANTLGKGPACLWGRM